MGRISASSRFPPATTIQASEFPAPHWHSPQLPPPLCSSPPPPSCSHCTGCRHPPTSGTPPRLAADSELRSQSTAGGQPTSASSFFPRSLTPQTQVWASARYHVLVWLVVYSSTCLSPRGAQFRHVSDGTNQNGPSLSSNAKPHLLQQARSTLQKARGNATRQHSQNLAGGITSLLSICTCSVNLGRFGRR